MDLLNSLFVSVFGMVVVFIALISLIVMINIQTFFAGKMVKRQNTLAAATNAANGTAVIASTAAIVSGARAQNALTPASPELRLTGVDEKTAAIIMAIVCDDAGVAPNELYFKSITALD